MDFVGFISFLIIYSFCIKTPPYLAIDEAEGTIIITVVFVRMATGVQLIFQQVGSSCRHTLPITAFFMEATVGTKSSGKHELLFTS